jgi:hypothetical protein
MANINRCLCYRSLLPSPSLLPPRRASQPRFENHQFTPHALTLASGQPFTITVINAAKQTIEFESFKLKREALQR